ncbi:MAG: dihydroorotate dehydrogenase [Nitrospirota bacterium]|nr:dihydroorotate dehydrogenase [Nitrospirota bacterium]
MSVDTSVIIAGIRMKNPVMTASGTFGYGAEYSPYLDLNRLGAIVVKGLSVRPKKGNPTPRICETPAGMLNAIGLENVGVDVFVEKKLPYLRQFDTPVIVNMFGNNEDDYVAIAERLTGVNGVAGLEVNISCPNVKEGGIAFGTDTRVTHQLITKVRKATTLPLIVKLSPNVTNIVDFAKTAADAGADALSLINTLLGMAIDIKTRRPRLANVTGGLSGPAIRPVAVRMVWQVRNNVKLPIIGMGGIMTADDAVEFMIAGATAVAIGTANFVNPSSSVAIADGIKSYMETNGIASVDELVGSLRIGE